MDIASFTSWFALGIPPPSSKAGITVMIWHLFCIYVGYRGIHPPVLLLTQQAF